MCRCAFSALRQNSRYRQHCSSILTRRRMFMTVSAKVRSREQRWDWEVVDIRGDYLKVSPRVGEARLPMHNPSMSLRFMANIEAIDYC